MTRAKDHSPERLLTEVELELMTIIWSLGEAAVKDVSAALPKSRRLAYTSVATVMRILEQKKFLRCEKASHAHVFSPAVSKSAYEASCLNHIVTSVFDGEPVALVQRLLQAQNLSAEDLRAIEATLKTFTAKGKDRNS